MVLDLCGLVWLMIVLVLILEDDDEWKWGVLFCVVYEINKI
jgi:biotin transporter BioY